MADPGAATQKAIYAALNGAISCPVYDRIPKGAAYPYVVIDRQDADADDPLASRRDVRRLYVSVWSDYPGQKEVLDIIAEIDAVVHNARLAMDTGRMVIARMIRRNTRRDADGESFMGDITIELVTEH